MVWYLVKLLISAGLIVAVSEVSKHYSRLGGVLASLPLISFLGMIWLYVDTQDPQKVADLAVSVFWLVLPSLVLFAALPPLLKLMHFAIALPISTALMFAAYGLTMVLLRKFGVGA